MKTNSSKNTSLLKPNHEFEKYFKSYLVKHFNPSSFKIKSPSKNILKKSVLYTTSAPSSHFRSLLAIETARYLKQDPKKIFPWALAIEMFHSGSLIFDDLPILDDGKIRRGKKCNHLVFGEDISLLAGSCLFIESFSLLKQPIFKNKLPEILNLFISKIGYQGVLSGLALELKLKKPATSEILKTIQLKTGSLLEAAVEGPLLLWAKNQKTKTALTKFAKYLGMAYQISDDLQDRDSLFNLKEEEKLLKDMTQKSLQALSSLKGESTSLKNLVLLNEKRSLGLR